MEPITITWTVVLGAVGGLLGALRSFGYAADARQWGKGVSNIAIGMAAAAAVGGQYVDPQQPWLALLLGVATGASGGYVLDAFGAVAPSMARDGLRAWGRRILGIPAEQKDEDGNGL